jgi:hypothetical protein
MRILDPLMRSKSDIYESTYKAYKDTLDNQLQAEYEISKTAVEIIKFDLLIGSLVIAALSYVGPSESILYIISGIIALVVSIWYCIQAVSPTEYEVGLDENAVYDVEEAESLEKHYEDLMWAYSKTIETNTQPYYDNLDNFKRGLWSALLALLFFSGTGIRAVLPNYPISYDFPVLLILTVIVFWARDIEE